MNATDIVITYHERTKHRLERYAAGPETLDWDAQPNPFREFTGSPRIILPLQADMVQTRFTELYDRKNQLASQALSLQSLAALLQLSFGLSAWKAYGPDRWALRCNPSSGNLHPTEAYLISQQIPGLDDGVYHYVSRDHVLEQRSDFNEHSQVMSGMRAYIGLTSIHWREAWKYGERAFRYCQLDIGHALGAVRYAAAALGWQVQLVANCNSARLAELLGLSRTADFHGAEHEEPDLLLAIHPDANAASLAFDSFNSASDKWQGQANILDRHPIYRWPIIDEVAKATQLTSVAADKLDAPQYPALAHQHPALASTIIQQRRSAQHFDAKYTMAAADFFHLLDCLLPRANLPFDVWKFAPRIHPLIFVNRIDDILPGIYILIRADSVAAPLRNAMNADFSWTPVAACPAHLPLWRLADLDCGRLSRTLHCHQAIGMDSCFALGMLAEFNDLVQTSPWRYRQLHWEAGLLGQILYLEAEAMNLRGTGIGCFFDDAFHEVLGLQDRKFQSLYHFTVGRPLVDTRIATLPPYAHLTQLLTEDNI